MIGDGRYLEDGSIKKETGGDGIKVSSYLPRMAVKEVSMSILFCQCLCLILPISILLLGHTLHI